MGVDVEVLSPGDGNYTGFIFLGTRQIPFSLPSGEPLPFRSISLPPSFFLVLFLSLSHARVRVRTTPRARYSENLAFR